MPDEIVTNTQVKLISNVKHDDVAEIRMFIDEEDFDVTLQLLDDTGKVLYLKSFDL